MSMRGLVLGLVGAALSAGVATAQEPPGNDPGPNATQGKQSPETAAIRAQAEAFIKAFNAGDARGVARLHTADARVIDVTGEVVEGRDAIEREYAALFDENKGLKLEIHMDNLRLVSPDAAIDEGTTRVVPKDDAAPVLNRYTAVSVKRNGEWLLASVRESSCDLDAEEQLRPLAWMEGEWVDESSDSVIQTSCHFTPDKHALIREFSIQSDGKVVMTGTQRIGWDPRSGQIKSWEFDSEGGHGEGLWASLGNQWVVKATAVLQDGRTATATHIITPEDASTCRWRTTDRTVGGQVIPVSDEFVMVRPAPKAGTRVNGHTSTGGAPRKNDNE